MRIHSKKQVASDSPVKNAGQPCSEQENGWDTVEIENIVGHEEETWCIVSEDGKQFSEEVNHKGWGWNKEVVAKVVTESASTDNKIWSSRIISPNILKKPQNLAVLKKPHTILLLVHLLVGMIVIISLALDRHSWRNSALRFEDQLRQITEPKPEVQEEAWVHIEQTDTEPKEEMFFDSMKCSNQSENVFLDTCWPVLRSEVTQTMGALAKITWRAALRLQKQATSAAARRFPGALASNYYSSDELKGMPRSLIDALRSLSPYKNNISGSSPEALWSKIVSRVNETNIWVV
jgi:hypothetical protein